MERKAVIENDLQIVSTDSGNYKSQVVNGFDTLLERETSKMTDGFCSGIWVLEVWQIKFID